MFTIATADPDAPDARVLLAALERQALAFGYRAVWLETRRVNVRAVAFYEKHGYRVIPNFGKYAGRPDAVCLGKPA
jgi:ribosomal protein S18 acetylase RimI-like enzyme